MLTKFYDSIIALQGHNELNIKARTKWPLFTEDIPNWILLTENYCISLNSYNKSALEKVMAWCWTGNKSFPVIDLPLNL